MSNFNRFRSNQPCPVCGKKGKCAELDHGGSILCYSVRGPDSPLLIGGWKWVSEARNEMGSVVRMDDQSSASPSAAPRKERPATKNDLPRDVEEDKDNLQKALDRQRRRHELYKQLTTQLTLSDEHRQQLRDKRGLTDEQIDELFQIGFRSIARGAHLLDESIPAIGDDGIYRGKAGFLIPAVGYDEDGQPQLRGFQLAVNEEEQNGGGKYIWLSGDHVENKDSFLKVREPAELDQEFKQRLDKIRSQAGYGDSEDGVPLFQYRPKHKIERIALTDGALKTFVTGMRQGVAAFGAPAFNYTSCLSQLLSSLENLMGQDRSIRILISADAGDLDNQALLSSLVRVATILDLAGFDVRWADLKQERGKELGEDIDEADYMPEEISTFEMLRRTRPAIRRQSKKSSSPTKRGIFEKGPADFFDVEIPFSTRSAEKYPRSQRFEVLKKAINDGFKVILFRDPTGLGKSHFLAHLKAAQLEDLGVTSLRILSERYLEQSSESNLSAVYGRGYGVKRDEVGVLRARKNHEDAGKGVERASNCHLADRIHTTYRRNISSVGSGICRACPYQEQCKSTEGHFLYDRSLALTKAVTILHPGSLKSDMLKSERLANGETNKITGLAFDDVTASAMIDEVEISISRIPALAHEIRLAQVSRALPDFLMQMYQQLSSVSSLSSSEIEARLRPIAQKHLKKGLSWDDAFDVETSFVSRSKEDFQAWLPVLKHWVNSKPGDYRATFRIHRGVMTGSSISERLRDAMRAAEFVVFTDATQTAEEAAAMAGIRVDQVKVLQAFNDEHAPAPLAVRQIYGVGALGYGSSAKQTETLRVVLQDLKSTGWLDPADAALIDTKARIKEVSGEFGDVVMPWMSDSRGSNRGKDAQHLVMIGSPRPNLGAAAARYQLLFGELVDLEHKVPAYLPVITNNQKSDFLLGFNGAAQTGFRRYYLHLLEAELIQGIGRLRHNAREASAGKPLRITVIGDVAVPLPVELIHFEKILEAPSKDAIAALRDAEQVEEMARALAKQGQNVTHQAIAETVGASESLVAAYISEKRLRTLESKAALGTLPS